METSRTYKAGTLVRVIHVDGAHNGFGTLIGFGAADNFKSTLENLIGLVGELAFDVSMLTNVVNVYIFVLKNNYAFYTSELALIHEIAEKH